MRPVPVLVTPEDLPRVAAVVALGLVLSSWLALQLDEIYTADDKPEEDVNPDFYYPAIGYFLSAYFAAMVVSRYFGHGTYIVYEALWGCNVAILLVVMGVFLSRPFLVGMAMAIVSGDQLAWYLDGITYLLTGKFPIGAMTYLTYPENRSFSKRFFATHHIWFLPLCLWVTKTHGGMHESSFIASCCMTAFLAVYSRMFTPFEVKVPGDDHVIYLNVNGAFAFWKDIDIPLLHVLDHQNPAMYLPYLAVVGNFVVNGFPHIVILGCALTLRYRF